MQVFVARCYGKLWEKVEYIQFKNSVEKPELVCMFAIQDTAAMRKFVFFFNFTVYLVLFCFSVSVFCLFYLYFFSLLLENKISELTVKHIR